MFYKIWLRSNSFTSMLTSPGQVARGFQLQSALFLTILGWHQVCPVPGFFLYPGASLTLTLDLSHDLSVFRQRTRHSCPVRGRGLSPSLSGGLFCSVLWAFLRDHKSGPSGLPLLRELEPPLALLSSCPPV